MIPLFLNQLKIHIVKAEDGHDKGHVNICFIPPEVNIPFCIFSLFLPVCFRNNTMVTFLLAAAGAFSFRTAIVFLFSALCSGKLCYERRDNSESGTVPYYSDNTKTEKISENTRAQYFLCFYP